MRTLTTFLFGSIFMTLFAIPAFAHDHKMEKGLIHLKFKGGELHAHCKWIKGPVQSDESILEVDWKNGKTHKAVDIAPGTMKVDILMPSMSDMKNPEPKVAPILDDKGKPKTGEYQVSKIDFSMDGDWVVHVTLVDPQGHLDTQTIPVHVGPGK